MSVKEFYDQIADSYDGVRYSTAYERRVGELELDFIGEYLTHGRCLEVGAGTGRVTKFLAQNYPQVTAVDISTNMLEKLKANLSTYANLTTYPADVNQLNLVDGYGGFDNVICLRVLPHLDNPLGALAALRDAVVDRGVVAVDLWNAWGYRALLTKLRLKHLDVLTDYYTPGRMRSLLANAGLKIVARRGFGFPPLRLFRSLEGRSRLPLHLISQRTIWICRRG